MGIFTFLGTINPIVDATKITVAIQVAISSVNRDSPRKELAEDSQRPNRTSREKTQFIVPI
jgi:hypothetical protein